MTRFDPTQARHYESTCMHPDCPFGAGHRRLQEAHRYWHMAATSYPDPEAFRTHLNAAIQALRNVTFAVQSQKRAIPGFDEWYASWQKRMRGNAVLRWLVEARNTVLKQGDLATRSLARVKVLRGWGAAPECQFDLPPKTRTEHIVKLLLATAPETLRGEALLSVERRWIANSLPDHELLDALALVYAELSALLAHGDLLVAGGSLDAVANQAAERLDCMRSEGVKRIVFGSLKDGSLRMVEESRVVYSPAIGEIVRQRYGDLADADNAVEEASELRALAQRCFAQARRIMEVDGHHTPMAIYLTRSGHVVPQGQEIIDREDIYAAMEIVAANVRHMDAKAVLWIGEAWMAPVPERGPIVEARHSPDRIEILQLEAVAEDDEHILLMAKIQRTGTGLTLGPTEEIPGVASPYLDGVKRVWKGPPAPPAK